MIILRHDLLKIEGTLHFILVGIFIILLNLTISISVGVVEHDTFGLIEKREAGAAPTVSCWRAHEWRIETIASFDDWVETEPPHTLAFILCFQFDDWWLHFVFVKAIDSAAILSHFISY